MLLTKRCKTTIDDEEAELKKIAKRKNSILTAPMNEEFEKIWNAILVKPRDRFQTLKVQSKPK